MNISNCKKKCARFILHDINIARHIANHLIGEHHTDRHRMIIGGFIMLIGVLFAKSGEHYYLLHIATEMGGYFVHAIGAIPFIEKLSSKARNPNTDI